jgi:N-acetylglucosaminyl-diphospho-decaprenol L-rhamnosyltransferase
LNVTHASSIPLSVVIVTHNGRELALRTLESAFEAAAGLNVEWVIVDSGSTDGTPDAIEDRWPDLSVLRLANVGFAAANNVGFKAAHGRYLLALNPDTEIRSGTFAELLDIMDAEPQIGAASVIQEKEDGTLQPSIRRDPSVGRALSEALWLRALPGLSFWQEQQMQPEAYERDHAVDWVVGAFLLLRRDVIDAVGGFDERFFMYSEETDLCRRIRDAGWQVRHLPSMRILHYGGAPSPRLMAQQAFSRIEYARKHFGHGRAALYRAIIALHHGVRAIAFRLVGGKSERQTGEREATRVALGLSAPPFAPPVASADRVAGVPVP